MAEGVRGSGSRKRCLVTGGTGFIGSHLLPRLAAQADVTLLLREGTASRAPGILEVVGDVTAPGLGASLPDVDVVYHMAAVSYVPAATRDPVEAFRVNALGTLHVLEAARRMRTNPRVVFLSTGQVYGRPQRTPVDEAHPLAPANVYGATKLAADRLVQSYHDAYALPTVVLRVFNVYGPGQSPDFVIPGIVAQLKRGERPVMGDGSIVRDFTYVDDFVAALVAAGSSPGAIGETLNVGSGHGVAVGDVARILMRLAGMPGEPIFDEKRYRANDVRELVVDNRRATAKLGWSPKVALEEGLARTWRA